MAGGQRGRRARRRRPGPQPRAGRRVRRRGRGARPWSHAVEQSTRRRAAQATGWPVTAWLSRLKPDPLRRLHLDLGPRRQGAHRERARVGARGHPRRSAPASTPPSARSPTTSAPELTPPWADAVRRASVVPAAGPQRRPRPGGAVHRPRRRADPGVVAAGARPAVGCWCWSRSSAGCGCSALAVLGYLQVPAPGDPRPAAASRCRRCCCSAGWRSGSCSAWSARLVVAAVRPRQGAVGRPAAARGDRRGHRTAGRASPSRPRSRPTGPPAPVSPPRCAEPRARIGRVPSPGRGATRAVHRRRRRPRRPSYAGGEPVPSYTPTRGRGASAMNEAFVTFQGWVGNEVVHRETQQGNVANFRVGSTPADPQAQRGVGGRPDLVVLGHLLAHAGRPRPRLGPQGRPGARPRPAAHRRVGARGRPAARSRYVVEATYVGHDLNRGTAAFVQGAAARAAPRPRTTTEHVVKELDPRGGRRPAAARPASGGSGRDAEPGRVRRRRAPVAGRHGRGLTGRFQRLGPPP